MIGINQTSDQVTDSTLVQDDNTGWLNTKWRPMMGWMYMAVCVCDFIVFPVFWSLIQVYGKGKVDDQWNPLTLQGAGFFHLAMGAVLGITSFGRSQEKMTAMTTPTVVQK